MLVDHAEIDPTLTPKGKGSLMIMVLDNYSRWKDFQGESYKQKKEEVSRKLIQRAEKYLPGLTKNIEVMELATPKTMQRFTLSPEGAIYGFAQTVLQSSINRLKQETAIHGLFLAGAWTYPGHGIHGCFVSGMIAADLASKFLPSSKKQ
jgi:prolycopene isomerase